MTGLDLCRSLLGQYGAAEPALWRPAPEPIRKSSLGPAAGHVFVVGFPRSGTSLLEQALAGHPDIVTLEEKPTLTPAIDAYLDPPVNIDALTEMDAAAADHWRAAYWDRVQAHGVAVEGKVFIDKQPFYTFWLPLIGKLFPQARVVVVRRDPRDVVLSCLRNPFRMTPLTYDLMDLERSARLYAAAMDILELCMRHCGAPVFAYRHEDLVGHFQAIAADLCAFLGLDWSERILGFASTAKARDIRTPSAGQVERGLNRDGIGVWRRYGDALAPVLPILEPVALRYGYPPCAEAEA